MLVVTITYCFFTPNSSLSIITAIKLNAALVFQTRGRLTESFSLFLPLYHPLNGMNFFPEIFHFHGLKL